ncbi:MAG: pteridine-dependent deoxygenase [Lysobacterales bacterium]
MPDPAHSHLPADSLPPLDFRWLTAADAGAVDPARTLARITFGGTSNRTVEPGEVRVPLVPVGPAPVEAWLVTGPVSRGVDGSIRWTGDRDYLHFAIELEEGRWGGLAATAEAAYRGLLDFLDGHQTPHLLRIWNHVDSINEGDGDAERYRQFCVGRQRGIAGRLRGFPAATAIGCRNGRRVLQVYGLAARLPGRGIENPRQVSAWNYPRRYGPSPPAFARALATPAGTLLLSGTAAVVGHASRSDGDLEGQMRELLANIDGVATASGLVPRALRWMLKAYVRERGWADRVTTAARSHFGGSGDLLVLEGDVCRRELLVEIDGHACVTDP